MEQLELKHRTELSSLVKSEERELEQLRTTFEKDLDKLRQSHKSELEKRVSLIVLLCQTHLTNLLLCLFVPFSRLSWKLAKRSVS